MTEEDYKAFAPDAFAEFERQQARAIKHMCWEMIKSGLIIGAMLGVLFNLFAWWLA
jgi:hypothetical protein